MLERGTFSGRGENDFLYVNNDFNGCSDEMSFASADFSKRFTVTRERLRLADSRCFVVLLLAILGFTVACNNDSDT